MKGDLILLFSIQLVSLSCSSGNSIGWKPNLIKQRSLVRIFFSLFPNFHLEPLNLWRSVYTILQTHLVLSQLASHRSVFPRCTQNISKAECFRINRGLLFININKVKNFQGLKTYRNQWSGELFIIIFTKSNIPPV